MRKSFFFLLFILSSAVSGFTQAYRSSITFQKNKYPAATLQVPFETDLVIAGVKDYLSRKGYKNSSYKEFLIFRSAPFDTAGRLVGDAYFQIERKSGSEKDITYVHLLPVKKDQPLSPGNIDDSLGVDRAVWLLNKMNPYLISYGYQQEIKDQKDLIRKIQSKITRLKNDSGDIATRIRNYENNLKDNKNDQDKANRDIQAVSSGDAAGLAKANKQLSKLMDRQNEYEKKLRNAHTDADQNKKDLEDQRDQLDKETQVLNALNQKEQSAASMVP